MRRQNGRGPFLALPRQGCYEACAPSMKLLITAGPTREPLDPVRYLSNRSSGRMGFALAEIAASEGHEVVLIAGPTALLTPAKVQRIDVETAQQMYQAVQANIAAMEAAIFAAAVADYRPIAAASQKLKKDGATMTLELERTPDILGSARETMGFKGVLVGFAAETERLIEHAQAKLRRKHCDMIVANDVSQPGIGFDSLENAVTLCYADGHVREVPRISKLDVARCLITAIEALRDTALAPFP